jgi:hypothetical protein
MIYSNFRQLLTIHVVGRYYLVVFYKQKKENTIFENELMNKFQTHIM